MLRVDASDVEVQIVQHLAHEVAGKERNQRVCLRVLVLLHARGVVPRSLLCPRHQALQALLMSATSEAR